MRLGAPRLGNQGLEFAPSRSLRPQWRLTYITKTCKAHEAAVCPSQKHASICFCWSGIKQFGHALSEISLSLSDAQKGCLSEPATTLTQAHSTWVEQHLYHPWSRLPGAEEKSTNGYSSLLWLFWWNLSVKTESSYFSNCSFHISVMPKYWEKYTRKYHESINTY